MIKPALNENKIFQLLHSNNIKNCDKRRNQKSEVKTTVTILKKGTKYTVILKLKY